MDKTELIITALQQRIGELVSNYEIQNAVLRAEITQLVEQDKDKQANIDNFSQALNQKCESEELLMKEIKKIKHDNSILEKTNEDLKSKTTKT
jgi:hypothetical protein